VALSLRRWHDDARQAPQEQGAVDEAAHLADPLAALAVDTVSARNPRCRSCQKSLRLAWTQGNNRAYGYQGNGYFCTLACALSFAVAAVRLVDAKRGAS
jgi:hypothetical protein